MTDIVPFTSQHLEDAAALFRRTYAGWRRRDPAFPPEQTSASVAGRLSEITADHPAFAAIDGTRLAGYLAGYSNIEHLKGSASGTYVPSWAFAVSSNSDGERIFYHLYRRLSHEWVARRCTTHIISYHIPNPTLAGLLHDLCFGIQVIDGLRATTPTSGPVIAPETTGVHVREAVSADLSALTSLHRKLVRHLNAAPVFLHSAHEDWAQETRAEDFFGPRNITFVAEKDGRIVSAIRGQRGLSPGSDLLEAPDTLGINFGYTEEDLRGSDIATGVLAALVDWAAENGMQRLAVDFESQNREAKVFWLRHFRPVFHSVMRKVDDRIAVG